MYMLVAFLALLAFLGGVGGKSDKNVKCAKEWKDRIRRIYVYFVILFSIIVTHFGRKKTIARCQYKIFFVVAI